MNTTQDIRRLGTTLARRFDPARFEDAMDHLDRDDPGVALELLAERLRDLDVPLTERECDRFDRLAARLGLSHERFQFLRERIARV